MAVDIEEEIFCSVQMIKTSLETIRRRCRENRNDKLQLKMHRMMENFLTQINGAVKGKEDIKDIVEKQKREVLSLKNEMPNKKLDEVINKAKNRAKDKAVDNKKKREKTTRTDRKKV